MKAALYYTVVGDRWASSGFRVMAVTSVKGTRRGGRVYGRELPFNTATSTTADRCNGKFATEDEAQAGIAELATITAMHTPIIEEARRVYIEKDTAMRNAIAAKLVALNATGHLATRVGDA